MLAAPAQHTPHHVPPRSNRPQCTACFCLRAQNCNALYNLRKPFTTNILSTSSHRMLRLFYRSKSGIAQILACHHSVNRQHNTLLHSNSGLLLNTSFRPRQKPSVTPFWIRPQHSTYSCKKCSFAPHVLFTLYKYINFVLIDVAPLS